MVGSDEEREFLGKLEAVLALYDVDGCPPAQQVAAFTEVAAGFRRLRLPVRAIPLYQRILTLLESLETEPSVRRAVTHFELATVCSVVGEHDAAMKALLESARILQDHHPAERKILYSVLLATASYHFAQERFAEAEAIYLDLLDVAENVLEAREESIAATYHNLGVLYLKMEELAKAEAALTRAISLKKQLFGPSHPQVGMTLYNLSGLYGKRGDEEAARATKDEAIKILGRDPFADHPQDR